MDVTGRYVAIILAVILLFLFPLQYVAQSQSETIDDAVCSHATEFTDTVRHQGYITLDMYEELIHDLDQTGEFYDITLETAHPVSGKDTKELTLGDEMPGLELEPVSFIRNSSTQTTLGEYGKISLFAAHTHNDACYNGTVHTHSSYGGSCYSSSGTYQYYCGGCQSTISYCGGCSTTTTYCGGCVKEYYGWNDCPCVYTNHKGYADEAKTIVCGCMDGADYGWYDGYNWVCPGHTSSYCPGHSSTYCPGHTGTTYTLSCNKTEGIYYNGNTQVHPICNTVVTSITASSPSQTVDKGGGIITTANATLLDGTTKTVNCTSNYNPNTVGNQTVTLTYTGLVGNAKTTGTRTCTINVTVREVYIPASLSVVPSANEVYNGKEPVYVVTVNYVNGETKILTGSQYTKTGWSSGAGIKTVTFSYTENSVTVTKNITITVKPNLVSITTTPTTQNIRRYSNPAFTVRAYYENSTNKVISSGYSVTGLNANNLGTQTVTISYTENSIKKTTTATVVVMKMTAICPICNSTYELDDNNIDRGCPICAAKATKITISPSYLNIRQGSALPITVTAIYQNGKSEVVTGWTSNYDPNFIGIREVKVEYQGLFEYITVETLNAQTACHVCGKQYDLNNDNTDPGCPICSIEVESIKVLEDFITIKKHNPLPITVIATYKDGHYETISDWTASFVTDTTGTFVVTVYYQSVSDDVTVTIIDDGHMECSYCGLEYDISDSPNGCPICSKTIVGIEAYLRNGGTQVIYKSQLNLKIILLYRDTHRLITYTGYTVAGYHPDIIGTQLVTVSYDTFSTLLAVEVISGPARITCLEGHEYYLNEDNSDPGCPFCYETDKEEAIFYFETIYTTEIINELYEDGIFYLVEGDYLTITVTKRDVSLRSGLKKMFFGTNSGIIKKKYTFGGEVM
jgi:rubrerythrin